MSEFDIDWERREGIATMRGCFIATVIGLAVIAVVILVRVVLG